MKTTTFIIVVLTLCLLGSCTPSANNIPDLIPYRVGAKWGYVDAQQNFLIAAMYDDATPFWGAVAVVKIKDKYKIINKAGDYLSAFSYVEDSLKSLPNYGLLTVGYDIDEYRFFKNGLAFHDREEGWGMVDPLGALLIKPVGTQIEATKNGLWIVEKEGLQALFSEKGHQLTAFKYTWIDVFREGMARFIVPSNHENWSYKDQYGFVNTKGQEVVAPIFYAADTFSNGLAAVAVLAKKGACDRLKFGFIDRKGILIIEPQYDAVRPFDGTCAAVQMGDSKCHSYHLPKWGVINKRGEKVVPINYSQVYPVGGNYWQLTAYPSLKHNEKRKLKSVLVDESGKEICGMNEGFKLGDDFIVEQGRNWIFELKDHSGKVLIPFQKRADMGKNEPSLLVHVSVWDDQYAYINPIDQRIKTGPINTFSISDTIAYDFSMVTNDQKKIIIGQNELSACIDRGGNTILEPQANILYPVNESWLLSSDSLGNYPVNWKGESIGTLYYDYVAIAPKEALYTVYKIVRPDSSCYDSKTKLKRPCPNTLLYGLIDEKGQTVFPPVALHINRTKENWLIVQYQSGLTGIVDLEGKEVLVPKYLEISSFENGLARVKTINKEQGYIDEAFNEYFEEGPANL